MYAVRGESCRCSGVGASCCCFDSNDVGLGAGSGDDSFAGCSVDLRFGNGGSDDSASGFVMVIMTDEIMLLVVFKKLIQRILQF